MNILFITEDYSTKNGGITTVISQLTNELRIRDSSFHPYILTTGEDAISQDEQIPIELIKPSKIGSFWKWSPTLPTRIDEIILSHKIDVIHIHGVWMAAQWLGLSAARRRKIPHILSVHGMLEPWFWGASINPIRKFKKSTFFHLFFYPNISPNTNIHAITPLEKKNLMKWFPQQKITVIPNAISITDEIVNSSEENIENPENIILFLGRLHPIKGVDLLIRSFHKASLGKQWSLVIAGPEDTSEYLLYLKKLISDLQLTSQVSIIGPVFGSQKSKLLQKSWVMVTPSYSEVIGMVNLEAAKYRLPSITTYETGLVDWEDGGGILINPNKNDLTSALLKSSSWSLSERIERGEKSYQLVKNKYSWGVVFPLWKKLYNEVT